MSESLSLLFTKEWLWANRSSRSLQKSASEQIALKFFQKKSYISDSLVIRANCSWKTVFFVCFLQFFPLFMPKSESLLALFLERWEQFFKERPWANRSRCSLRKSATMSNFLSTLMTKEQRERFALFHKRIALSLTKNLWLLEKPMSESPTLHFRIVL